jgi:adenylate cyclase
MKLSFVVAMPNGPVQTYPVEKRVTKIGRAPDNDIVLVDAERSVSRWHATITCEGAEPVSVEDLNSANGTMVNGQLIKGVTALRPKDVIAVGAFRISVRQESGQEDRFSIQAGTVGLDELQKKPDLNLSTLSGEAVSPNELRNLELLYEVGVRLARSHSVAEVTSAAIELLFKIDQVHRATVILWDEKRGMFASSDLHMRNAGKANSLPRAYDPANLVMSRTILNRVRQENLPLLIRDAKSEEGLNSAVSIVRAGIQAAFCSPLTFKGRFLGILYADNLAEPDVFSAADFCIFTSIAAQTGLAMANAIANQELIEGEVVRQAMIRYLPPQVADLISASGGESRLDGELQAVTVLYADIRGFTTMSEKMDAHEIVAMLREFFSTMSAAVMECNGTVDKFIGDCIMSLFGAPVQSELAPRDGLKAAVLMQRRMLELNAARAKRNAEPVHIGVGLHCGPAVVGNIGSADRVQYTAIGDTVNVASRLAGKAAPCQIIVSENIRACIPDYAGFQPLGEMELKGRTGKLNVYSVRWAEEGAV